MLLCALVFLFLAEDPPAALEQQNLTQLLTVKRVYVDRLTGGETAAQMRDMIISSLHGSRLFVITENQERADAFLRGSAEDLVYTNNFASSEGVNAHASLGANSGRTRYDRSGANVSVGAGENDSLRMSDRRHEATAAVRLVNKDGDVIWSTTQESTGGKFRGASADVADKITRQLMTDFDRAKRLPR